MSRKLTETDAHDSLVDHAIRKGYGIFERYGPKIGWAELQKILKDSDFVRFPCSIEFDIEPLEAGECVFPRENSNQPADGYTIFVHPYFTDRLELVPPVVLYQLVVINYGNFAGAEEAECFGAAAMGYSPDTYYDLLCELADRVS